VKLIILMWLLGSTALYAVPVVVEYQSSEGWTENTKVLVYRRIAADATQLLAVSEPGALTVAIELAPGKHSIFTVAQDVYGSSTPTDPLEVKIITLRHQASSNLSDWTDIAVTHELEQSPRQYRTLIEIP
jgi:hypothetical protein